jgi:hypothetical protein
VTDLSVENTIRPGGSEAWALFTPSETDASPSALRRENRDYAGDRPYWNRDIEHHPTPQCFHIGLGRSAVLAQSIDNFKVVAHLHVFRSQHAHGRQERDARGAVSVETLQ